MAKFAELNKYISDILTRLVDNQDLCKYIKYETNEFDPVDPLTLPNLSDEERYGLMYNRIFPFPKLPNDKELTAGTYMTVYFENIEQGGSIYFKDSVLVINVFSHLNQWRILGKLRPYAIMNEIDEMFNNKKTNGIGKTQFIRSQFLWVNSVFAGYTLKYKIVDFS